MRPCKDPTCWWSSVHGVVKEKDACTDIQIPPPLFQMSRFNKGTHEIGLNSPRGHQRPQRPARLWCLDFEDRLR